MPHAFWLAQITQPLLEKMLQQLRDTGNQVEPLMQVPSAGPAYYVSGSGITATVSFDAVNQRALVQIRSKPFLVPVSYIESQVREALRVARG
jgi:hypothetical protein